MRRSLWQLSACPLLAVLVFVGGAILGGDVLGQEAPFRRGDADTDGHVDVSDGVGILNSLFLFDEPVSCEDALDADDTGKLDLSDVLYLLNHLFLGGPALPAPGSEKCGLDPTGDELVCAEYLPPTFARHCAPPLPPGELFGSEPGYVLLDEPPHAMAIGDFNRDGNLDMALGGTPKTPVTVLLGRGDRTFEKLPVARFDRARAIPKWMTALETGDLNGDGFLDLVGAWPVTGLRAYTVLFGRGDGTFAPERNDGLPYAVLPPSPIPYALALGDLDEDGDVDLVSMRDQEVFVLHNVGDGTFNLSDSYTTPVWGSDTLAVHLEDVDGDGSVDIITANDGVSVLLNLGDGTFFDALPVEGASGRLALGDFDADGLLDIVSQGRGRGAVLSVLSGSGDGLFFPPIELSVGAEFSATTLDAGLPLLSEDVDGDGFDDIITEVILSTRFEVVPEVATYLSLGDGDFVALPSGFHSDFTDGAFLHDFDGDGFRDLTGYSSGLSSVSVHAGRAEGSFAGPFLSLDGLDLSTTVGILPGDFDGDGVTDLARLRTCCDVFTNATLELTIFTADGDGTLIEADRTAVAGRRRIGGRTLASGDFGGDGALDLLTADASTLQFHRNRRGSFRSSEAFRFAPGARGAAYVGHGDLNADGTLDVVALRGVEETEALFLVALLGDGRGRFVSEEPQSTSVSNYRGGALGDLDDDGDLDLVISRAPRTEVVTALNLGDGVFGELVTHSHAVDSGIPMLVHVNGDRHLDVVVEGGVFLGRGDGRLETRTLPWPLEDGRSVLGFRDMDADGRMDVVLTRQEGLSVLRGRGAGAFFDEERYTIRAPSNATELADFDGDGDVDVATFPLAGGGLAVHLNWTLR